MEEIKRYHPQAQEGLSSAQVDSRREEGLCNHPTESVGKRVRDIVKDNVCTLFNAINFVLGIALFFVGSYRNMLFMFVVVANIAIGIFQEVRSKRQVEKLSLISIPKAVVIRDGKELEIPVEQLVLDDVMVLRLGRQICSDGIVLEGEVEVNEALLTGESDPVIKKAGDQLLSGSFIVSGTCYALADRVGDDNYAAQITLSAKEYRKLESVLMDDLKKIIKFDSIVIIPLGILLLLQNLLYLHVDNVTAVTSVSAAMIGMIPEGLMLLTSISLAVSVIKLAKRRTLVQELYCIESLSRVDMLCLDKTGTITEGRMQVEAVEPLVDKEQFRQAGINYMCALRDANPTSEALQNHFCEEGDWEAVQTTAFSSSRKYGAVTFSDGASIVIGSPEYIGGTAYADIEQKVESYAAQGLRVVAIGRTEENIAEGLPAACTVLGLVAIGDKIRPQAKETLSFFAREGVAIKIISGDNPVTVSSVARRAGVKEWEQYIDASTLSDDQLPEAMEKYTVFGRVTPQQKKLMVIALKQQGHTVAMTGDGVNDVMALKMADCSIAMASGSDAARQVSHLVLLDNDFSVLPSVVMEGRRVINNITRTASLYLVKTIFSFLLTVATLLTGGHYPFEPIHFTVISSFGVGIPTFFLALEPNKARIKGRFLITVLKAAVPGALLIVFNIGVARFLSTFLQLSHAELVTVSFLMTAGVTLIILLRVCLPFTMMRGLLWGIMTMGMAIAGWIMHRWLGLVMLDWQTIIFVVIVVAVSFPLLAIIRKISDRIIRIFVKEDVVNAKRENNL